MNAKKNTTNPQNILPLASPHQPPIPPTNSPAGLAWFGDFSERKMSEVILGAAEAALLLERNTGNRPLCRVVVARYVDILKKGRWCLTQDAIAISSSGKLLNGQHRLHACVEAVIPITVLLVTGMDEDVFTAMDKGKKRTPGDDLSVQGEKNYCALAAAAKMQWHYEQGSLDKFSQKTLPTEDIQDVLRRIPELRGSVARAAQFRTKFKVPGRVIAFCHLRFSAVDPESAEKFFTDLSEGVGLIKGDPVLLLRDRLMTVRESKYSLDSIEILALTIKAWNHRRSGNYTLKHLRWRSRGEEAEAFPVIRG